MSFITAADLQGVELLAGFQADELEQFASRLNVRNFAEGEIVFSAGDSTRSLYLILKGRVQIDLVGKVVIETALAELGQNQVFGETTFFRAAEHNNTARCLEASQLAELPYSDYELLLQSNSRLAYHLAANAAPILAARLQATDQWIREMIDHDEELCRRDRREYDEGVFHPTVTTPGGYVGLGVNW